jgi:hypothetical protein
VKVDLEKPVDLSAFLKTAKTKKKDKKKAKKAKAAGGKTAPKSAAAG